MSLRFWTKIRKQFNPVAYQQFINQFMYPDLLPITKRN